MNKTQAVKALDALAETMVDDPESAHGSADEILLGYVPSDVRDAYNRVVAACRWWA